LAKPIVDGVERRLEGQASVVRLDVMSKIGQQAAVRYRVRAVPTVILLDGEGQVVLSQAGRIKAAEIETKVNELLSQGGAVD
jgi:thioredoxin-like negative regulator of GroEL